jgi:hypothetical protein
MRTDHEDDSAIAAWDAYSAVHKGYVQTHGGPAEHEPKVADDGAEQRAPGRRAEDPARSAIDGAVDTVGADQATERNARQSDG